MISNGKTIRNPQIIAAINYRDRGLSVIPIRRDGSKAPDVGEWKSYMNKPADEQVVVGWFQKKRPPGIAILGGKVSGNLAVLDFEDVNIFEKWTAIVRASLGDAWDNLVIVGTPRPGRHVYCLLDHEPDGSEKLAMRPATAEELAKKPKEKFKVTIETKSEGGYVLAPGSPGDCHETGKEYKFIQEAWVKIGNPRRTIDRGTYAEMIDAARDFDERPAEPTKPPPSNKQTRKTEPPTADDIKPIEDWNKRGPSIRQQIEEAGWTILSDLGEGSRGPLVRRPDKAKGHSGRIQKDSDRERLYVFSTSTDFKATEGNRPRGYDSFEVYAQMNHGGNASAAASALWHAGYGSRGPRMFHGDDQGGEEKGDAWEPPPPPDDKKEEWVSLRCTIGELTEQYPELRPPVIEGLAREGETGNIISYPKIGKSWLTLGLALSKAMGKKWFGHFAMNPGKVLFIDNELHKETIVSRMRTVAHAMGISYADYKDVIEYIPLRGQLQNIYQIEREIKLIKPGEFKMIVLDAKYRMIPSDSNENSNSDETRFYNQIDYYAEMTGAFFSNVHHASKGDQSGKRVTDVGAGAGAQSRAADVHLILRDHEEAGVAVVDAAVRSFAPIEPLAIRWQFPLWSVDEFEDPTKLKGNLNQNDQRQRSSDNEGIGVIKDVLKAQGRCSRRKIRDRTGISDDRLTRLLGIMVKEGDAIIHDRDKDHKYEEYELVNTRTD